jgi:hypothetical protein
MAESIYYVYVLFDHRGHPFYVGKGKRARWAKHERDAQKGEKSYKANIIRKTLRLLGSLPKVKIAEGLSEPDAHALEILLIATLGRRPAGLLVNHTGGGEGAGDLTPEASAKRRLVILKLWQDPEYRAAVINGLKQQVFTPERCNKISAAQKGKKRPREIVEKIAASKRGRPLSPKHREAIGRGNTGKVFSPERCEHISVALKKRPPRGPNSPEQNAKISAALKGRPKTEAHRAAATAGVRRRWAREKGKEMNERPRLQCLECKGWFDAESGFRLNPHAKGRGHTRVPTRRARCIGCEQEARDARKQANRWVVKARDTIRRHARKYGLSVSEFSNRYAWTAQRIAHDFQHAFDNTCPYCWRRYIDMPVGFANVTIDIRNREEEPFYHINTERCCPTCNTEKRDMNPQQWARRLQYWREKKLHDKTRAPLPEQLALPISS